MSETTPRPTHESTVPFDETRIHAAAIYCSDGRFGEQFDDFLQRVLGLPRYDRLAVPGGAACLAGHFAAYRECDVVKEQLAFLIEVHGLERLVLIAHQDCAFYTRRLEASPIGLAELQFSDLARAARAVGELAPSLAVETWFAHRHQRVVAFERVPS